MISQQKLEMTTSENCGLSIVLFDEVEKAAPSLCRLLLGVLDRAVLHLGDNTIVNFENSLIFLTSNLGAEDFSQQIRPEFGFRSGVAECDDKLRSRLERIARNAVKRYFSPEFVNRLDDVITYQPLEAESLERILDQHIDELQEHIRQRLGEAAFELELPAASRSFLLQHGTSAEYGARELKRTIHRYLMQPLATMVAGREVAPGSVVRVEVDDGADGFRFRVHRKGRKLYRAA